MRRGVLGTALLVGILGQAALVPAASTARDTSVLRPVAVFGLLPPVAVNDSTTAVHGQQRTVAAPGVLANDLQIGGGYTAVHVDGPSNGTLALDANGGYRYTSDPDFTGTDSFRYKVNGGLLGISNIATVTITVTNAAPVARNDAYTANAGVERSIAASGVLSNDTDADGDSLTAVLISGPSNGTLSLSANGSFRYTADGGFGGVDSFRYRASDGIAQSSVATVQITVTGPTPAPTPTPSPTPTPAPTPTPTVGLPTILPSLPPLPSASVPPLPGASTRPPTATPSPSPGATARPSARPTPDANSTPAPSGGGAAGGGTGTGGSGGSGGQAGSGGQGGAPVDVGPFDIGGEAGGPEPVAVDLDPGLIAFDGFEWAVPAVALSVPLLFLIIAIGSQAAIGMLWVPLSRRWLGGDRRRRRAYVTVG